MNDDMSTWLSRVDSEIFHPERRVAHGAAGEVRSIDFSWDMVNQEMADTYIRLVRRSGEKAAQSPAPEPSHKGHLRSPE